jgi:hypothetical protein
MDSVWAGHLHSSSGDMPSDYQRELLELDRDIAS